MRSKTAKLVDVMGAPALKKSIWASGRMGLVWSLMKREWSLGRGVPSMNLVEKKHKSPTKKKKLPVPLIMIRAFDKKGYTPPENLDKKGDRAFR